MSFVITKTPFRVSFFGGATDYPQWYTSDVARVGGPHRTDSR